MTNAEKIRNLSDVDLAEFLNSCGSIHDLQCCLNYCHVTDTFLWGMDKNRTEVLNWLKQESTE